MKKAMNPKTTLGSKPRKASWFFDSFVTGGENKVGEKRKRSALFDKIGKKPIMGWL